MFSNGEEGNPDSDAVRYKMLDAAVPGNCYFYYNCGQLLLLLQLWVQSQLHCLIQ